MDLKSNNLTIIGAAGLIASYKPDQIKKVDVPETLPARYRLLHDGEFVCFRIDVVEPESVEIRFYAWIDPRSGLATHPPARGTRDIAGFQVRSSDQHHLVASTLCVN